MIQLIKRIFKTKILQLHFSLHFLLLLLTSSFTSAFCLLPSSLHSQDTIRYMSYNLLNYGLPYNLCDESQNNISLKDQYIRTIFSYVQPDMFAVVEMVKGAENAQRLLDSAINAAGPRVFAKTAMTNFSNSDIINMLYYDPEKFHLRSQDVIINGLRDINIYNFYLKTSDLSVSQDTIYLTAIIAHLKAGSGQDNELVRAQMTQSLMGYLNAHNMHGNLIISGDFNLYSSNEQAYQNLINHNNLNIRFYDPVDMPGDWNSNVTFAALHTQSTHASSNGCAASGGMDDRFDFILTTHPMMLGTEGMQNITETYHALGQDGLHYNTSINAVPDNTSVPPDVLQSLFNNSDHLPVIMDIRTAKALGIDPYDADPFNISVVNPAQDNILVYIGHTEKDLQLECIDGISQLTVHKAGIPSGTSKFSISAGKLKPGMYILRFISAEGISAVKKIVIL